MGSLRGGFDAEGPTHGVEALDVGNVFVDCECEFCG